MYRNFHTVPSRIRRKGSSCRFEASNRCAPSARKNGTHDLFNGSTISHPITMDYLHELSRRESTYLYRSMLIRLFAISNTVVTGDFREKIPTAIYPQELAQYVYVYIYCIYIYVNIKVCVYRYMRVKRCISGNYRKKLSPYEKLGDINIHIIECTVAQR